MTNIVGAGLLGVTIGCARCHDHKFDPFRQTDYYRMQGYFAQTQFEDIVRASLEDQKAWKEKAAPIQAEIQRTQRSMRGAQGDDRIKLEAKLDDLNDSLPTPPTALFAVKDDPAKTTPIRVLFRGDYLKPGDAVGMRPLGVLLPDDTPEMPLETEKPRTKLAAWVTDPANPLTLARDREPDVAVSFRPWNRLHHQRFRAHGRTALQSRAARLARQPPHRRRLEDEAAPPNDHDVERLSAVQPALRSRRSPPRRITRMLSSEVQPPAAWKRRIARLMLAISSS
jgi:hypothetical protein